MTRLTIQHASVGYPGRPVLREVSFSLTSGSVCCLLGANGSGKTTLMRSILGLLPLLSGQILIDSIAIAQMTLVTVRAPSPGCHRPTTEPSLLACWRWS